MLKNEAVDFIFTRDHFSPRVASIGNFWIICSARPIFMPSEMVGSYRDQLLVKPQSVESLIA